MTAGTEGGRYCTECGVPIRGGGDWCAGCARGDGHRCPGCGAPTKGGGPWRGWCAACARHQYGDGVQQARSRAHAAAAVALMRVAESGRAHLRGAPPELRAQAWEAALRALRDAHRWAAVAGTDAADRRDDGRSAR